MELFLIRHGTTEDNNAGVYCGSKDTPLSKKGSHEISSLKKEHNAPHPDIIYCSDRQRACQTAHILFSGRDITVTSALREMDFGSWESLTYQEISETHSDLYTNWLEDPHSFTPPAGEKMSDMEKRIILFLDSIIEMHPHQKIACVTHAGPIRIMACHLLKKNFRDFRGIPIERASVNYFQLSGQHILSYSLNKT